MDGFSGKSKRCLRDQLLLIRLQNNLEQKTTAASIHPRFLKYEKMVLSDRRRLLVDGFPVPG